MNADKSAIQRALDAPSDSVRLFLLHGPDDSGSEALAARLGKAMGPAADRTDFTGDQLGKDPAALSDAAASISLFGDKSWVRVSSVGEESLAAVEALLEAPGAGNPVVMIAGALRKTSKLLTRCLGDKAVLCFASYPPSERDAAEIAITIARERGLRIDQALARRIVELTGGDRALMAGEIEKLALYHDAEPDRPAEATQEALSALSSEVADQDAPALASMAMAGDVKGLVHEMARFRSLGGSLSGVLRIALGKAMNVAEVRAAIDAGTPQNAALRVNGRPLFKREADEMIRLLRCWPGETIGRGVVRLAAAERVSRGGAVSETVIAQELLTVARQAARGR
ncbi:DNA polymerase III subunit delta [Sphingobium sufflavum]|uniref:DNA polymerase III subunit delta n=1 Tax=Sphingobium sufflavum TaxID=1129547 RepID=UPI001F164038|nr:DNA polymerase III subunit delta [Sphingobium sufflavum]MCE7795051.1 DNA polymerase III subunit delta [Sphingobium sufflavum]